MTRYIDANELEKRTVLVEGDDFDGEYVIPYASFEMMPTVDAVPVVHAHWEYIDNVISYEGEFSAYECSHCHKTFLDDLCENNGSEMVDGRKPIQTDEHSWIGKTGQSLLQKQSTSSARTINRI